MAMIHIHKWKQNEYSKSSLPKNVTYFDVVEYLVDRESSYTRESFKAFTSLDAYKNFKAGWIKFLGSKSVDSGFCIVFARVKHSQKLNLKPTSCWVSVDSIGTIQTAHCDCMAGLEEACSRVGSVLFALESWSREEVDDNEPSCTDILNQWLVPPKKAVDYAEIKDIFSLKDQPTPTYDFQVTECGSEELNEFIRKLIVDGENPSVGQFIDDSRKQSKLNSKLTLSDFHPDPNMLKHLFCQFFHPNLVGKPLSELREISASTISDLHYPKSLVEQIARLTISQSSSWYWEKFRAGRITASTFKATTRTTIENPSLSLIRRICYPEDCKLSTAATRYGCNHEKVALEAYASKVTAEHENFRKEESGLHLDAEKPFFGASPDAIVKCDCCGMGAVEIKCPFCMRDGSTIKQYATKKGSPIQITDTGYKMDSNHQYFFQVQMQMYVLNTNFCDFVIWTCKDMLVLRVDRDDTFLKRTIES